MKVKVYFHTHPFIPSWLPSSPLYHPHMDVSPLNDVSFSKFKSNPSLRGKASCRTPQHCNTMIDVAATKLSRSEATAQARRSEIKNFLEHPSPLLFPFPFPCPQKQSLLEDLTAPPLDPSTNFKLSLLDLFWFHRNY